MAWREITASRHGFTRLLHALVGKLQGKTQMTYLLGLPTYISIELTNRCACTCALCPVGQRIYSRRLGNMPWEQFTWLVDQVSSHARFIGLYNWGDPFLHPRVYDMISYVASKKIYVKVSSTLRNWDPAQAEHLVRTGLDELKVSLHGASEETYRDYQPSHSRTDISFADALERIRALQLAKQRLGLTKPNITLGFIVTSNNEHEIDKLLEIARQLGVDYSLEETSLNLRFLPYDRMMNSRGVDEASLQQERKTLIERWLPKEDRYVNEYYRFIRAHAGILPPADSKWFSCKWPWQQVVISSNGDVNLCCGSYSINDRIGNVFELPLRKIWNNALYRAARRNIARCSGTNVPPVLCAGCPGRLL